MRGTIITDGGQERTAPPLSAKYAEHRARWLKQVVSDRNVSHDGRFVAQVVAFAADTDTDAVRMSSRDVIATCGAEAGELSADAVRAGIMNLRERGHLAAERDGRCWRLRLIGRLMVEA